MDDVNGIEEELSNSLHDLLRGISSPSSQSVHTQWSSRLQTHESPTTQTTRPSLPLSSNVTSSRTTPRPHGPPRSRTISTPAERDASASEPTHLLNQVSPPPRSIFVSGPPTSSVSANTAHASLSTTSASGSSLPLSALTGTGLSRRPAQRPPDLTISTASASIPGIEKDVDDLDNTLAHDGIDLGPSNTSQKLSSLFVSDTPGLLSREPTQLRPYSNPRSPPPDATTLIGHLLYNGFLGGKHSDITVHAFGQRYRLHKLILDRAPYFSSAFCGPWTESSANEVTIVPEEIDPNITQTAFELALKRLYGTSIASQEEQEAVGLFATACWLDMPDLVDVAVDYILKQMTTTKLHTLIKLVTTNYYGRPGDRILSSAKAMLCREGWEMPYEHWDYVPAEIIREIVGGDPFYVPGEWERWFLTLKILNRRLRRLAIEANLVDARGTYLHPPPQSLRFFAVRFDTTYRRDTSFGVQRQWSDRDDGWCSLYTAPEVSPLLVLLDEGIHYVHLRFEQLQHIRASRDILGVPVIPDKVVSDALWMQMELRQRVLNAHEGDLELGFSEIAEEQDEPVVEDLLRESVKGKEKEDVPRISRTTSDFEMDSGSWDGNGRPRKFWIPSSDVSCIVGGARDAVSTPAATTSGDWLTNATRLSASLEPSDVAWAADFAGNVFETTSNSRNVASSSPPRFSHYPPFRFSTEFPNPRTLKEKKRVYSQTVWYAGSMWNLYIQRINTQKGQQLGIYLHRAKDKDPSDDPLAQFVPASVDDRIGQLEREMLLRKANPRQHPSTSWHESAGQEHDERSSPTREFDGNTSMLLSPSRSISYPAPGFIQKSSQQPSKSANTRALYQVHRKNASSDSDGANMLPESPSFDAALIRANQQFVSSISTMPPYTDSRSTIKTYFKIYSPSKAGRLLSVYESAPDSFNFGKSWGWRSSQLILDDGIGYDSGLTSKPPTVSLPNGKESKLRYMVVIGIV